MFLLRGHYFVWNRGHEFPKVPRQYFSDPHLFVNKKFYKLPGHIMEKCILGTISFNKIFNKYFGHPIISWLFLWPLFLMKRIFDHQLFYPPYSKENDSPHIVKNKALSVYALFSCYCLLFFMFFSFCLFDFVVIYFFFKCKVSIEYFININKWYK